MNQIINIPTNEAIREIVRDEVTSALDAYHEKQQRRNKYMTRQQVADQLSITLSTVHSYINNGTLTAYKVNGRTLFKADEVDEALEKLHR